MNVERRNMYRLLVRKSEGKEPLGRPRSRWVNNIKMNLGETECGGMDWIGLVWDRGHWKATVNAVTNLRGPKKIGKSLNSCATGGLWRRVQFHGVSLVN
jgi:hypothetical protein